MCSQREWGTTRWRRSDTRTAKRGSACRRRSKSSCTAAFKKAGPRDDAQYLEGFLGEDSAVYKAIEYGGPFIEARSIEDRLLFPLMAIDLGAKAGLINPDEKTAAFAKQYAHRPFELFTNDPDVTYEKVIDVAVNTLEPQVSCPPTVGNVRPIGAAAGTEIQLAEIGGSTGGRLADLRVLASPSRAARSIRTCGCKWFRQPAVSILQHCARV